MNHASFYRFTVGVFVFEPCFPRVGAGLHFDAVVVAIPKSFGVIGFPNDLSPAVENF